MMNDKWMKTCNALKQLFKILSCSKCKKSLHDPQQFLNCGHFSCTSCINNENTSCVQCQLPHDNGNIIKDDAINQIIQACCTIAKEIGFCQDQENINIKPDNVSFMEQLDSKPNISDNILTSTNSIPAINLPKRGRKTRKRKGKKILNNEDSKKPKYDKCSTALRIPKDINKTNHHGETKLQEICKKGNLENIKLLLDAGANPNVADFAGWTPLQETVDFNYYQVSKLLLDRGANVNQPGYEGRTPLHEAAKNNNVEIVNLLLKYKANKESVDENGKRPVDYCQLEEVRKLLHCDEDIEIIFDKKRNNEENNTNNVNSKINYNSNNTIALENCSGFNSNAGGGQSVLQVVKEQKIEISNCSEINSQESIHIVSTNSMNENEEKERSSILHNIVLIANSLSLHNTESEEIDIMN